MSYANYIQADLPYAVYPLDTLTGARSVAPLVNGSGNAQVVGGANTASFTFPAFVQARRDRPFSLEAWFRPNTFTGPVIVLGHSNYDGIIWDTDHIKFTLKLASTTIDLFYYPEEIEAYHVVASYDNDTMTLWVNGELRDGHDFTSDEKAMALTANSDSTALVSGVSTTSESITIDAFALYAQKVAADMPARHYALGESPVRIINLLSAYSAGIFELVDDKLIPAMSRTWDSDWLNNSSNSSVNVDDKGRLVPRAGYSGTWQSGLFVDGLTGIQGSIIEWSAGGGVTISVSLDGGATWTQASNGYAIPGITAGMATAGKALQIKATLTGDLSYLDSLYVNIYGTNSFNAIGGNRAITITSPSLSRDLFYPMPFPQRGGMRASQATIATDPDGGTTTSIGFWVKPNSLGAASQVFFDSRSSSATTKPYFGWNGTAFVTAGFAAVYVDGNAFSAAAFTVNEWHYVTLVLSAAENVAYTVGADYTGANVCDGDIALVSLFPAALASGDVSTIYGAHFNFAGMSPTESGALSVAEQTPNYQLYDYDWSIVSR